MSVTPDGDHDQCDYPGCDAKVKNHRWGKTKADGWLFLQSGLSYCGVHHPDWVAQWRKNKEKK